MSIGTLLTIFVVPTMYSLLSRTKAHQPAHPVMRDDAHSEVIPAK